ncbi:MAG TPA: hypothetical protein VMA35_00660 [Candidatus Sulfopaludibacter sp.]|nr:hypothetical protein [Candidatus Sulfopaludibacter sp.]
MSPLWNYYRGMFRSRQHWVNFASQSLHNPYIALAEMFFVHPGAGRAAISRLFANAWSAIGTTSAYSGGRDWILKKIGVFDRDSIPGRVAVFFTDLAYGFVLNLPGTVINYKLSGLGCKSSVVLGIQTSLWGCLLSPVAGGLYDSFNALDSDDPRVKTRAPGWVQWMLINRIPLKVRRKLIWLLLAGSLASTAAIYSFAPGGLLR